jgi:hypothetical protein
VSCFVCSLPNAGDFHGNSNPSELVSTSRREGYVRFLVASSGVLLSEWKRRSMTAFLCTPHMRSMLRSEEQGDEEFFVATKRVPTFWKW